MGATTATAPVALSLLVTVRCPEPHCRTIITQFVYEGGMASLGHFQGRCGNRRGRHRFYEGIIESHPLDNGVIGFSTTHPA